MNNKSYLLTYIITLIGGALLIIMNSRAKLFEAIAVIIGIVFLVLGLVSVLGSLNFSKAARQAGKKPNIPMLVVSGGALALGLLMVIVPSFFVNYLVYMIGVMLILGGLMQLYSFVPGMRTFGLSGFFLSAPIISLIAGIIIMILGPDKVLNILALLAGIILVIFSLNGLIGYYMMNANMKKGKSPELIDIK